MSIHQKTAAPRSRSLFSTIDVSEPVPGLKNTDSKRRKIESTTERVQLRSTRQREALLAGWPMELSQVESISAWPSLDLTAADETLYASVVSASGKNFFSPTLPSLAADCGSLTIYNASAVNEMDAFSLHPGEWLTSGVINTFLLMLQYPSLLKSRVRAKEPPTFFVFNSFFFHNLERNISVSSWYKTNFRANTSGVFHYDLLFIPINSGNSHWHLGVVDFKKKCFYLYDSLATRDSSDHFFPLLRAYLQAHHKASMKKAYDFSGWKNCPMKCPSQQNNFDCGVFLLMVVDRLSRGFPVDFSQRDITGGDFRKRLFFDIYHRDFRHEFSLP